MHADVDLPANDGDPDPDEGVSPGAAAPAVHRYRARRLPLIGRWPVQRQHRLFVAMLVTGLLGLVLATVIHALGAARADALTEAAQRALGATQHAAQAAGRPLFGNPASLDELQQAAQQLGAAERDLQARATTVERVAPQALAQVRKVQAQLTALLGERPRLLQAGALVSNIDARAAELLGGVDQLVALKLQQGGAAAEFAAAGQLLMLTQRIPRDVDRLMTPAGVSRDALVTLGKDLSVFRSLLQALTGGDPDLRLSAPRDRAQQEHLQALLRQYDALQAPASELLEMLQPLASARVAQSAVADAAAPMRIAVQPLLGYPSGRSLLSLVAGAVSLLLLLGGGAGLLRLARVAWHEASALAESRLAVAHRIEHDARRDNDANQRAILRLMDEMQTIAEGDLTQQATVSEEITGAVADSLNYTIEELRNLVARVQRSAARVTATTDEVETTSVELLAASSEQLREIRDTGEAVLQMAGRIVQVSAQAQQMAHVARQSLAAADGGARAVRAAIGGMHRIREQMQDTSKRIKRLGESSQEIGEITELISDITEQTTVLALNAAVQAASAGEAGRGFSVVAEEVQRLAERSADATRQIAALVRMTQTDTQDAVAAMERSTQGVVEGTRLSDAAGAALNDIERVTRQLSELIAEISRQALQEVDTANLVATHIQHILAVTEQTGDGTRSTARMVRELAQVADELRQSVTRFKIA